MLDRCCVERIAYPIGERLSVHGCGVLPSCAFSVSAADRVDFVGRLPINAGRPSSPFPLTASRHRFMNHRYQKYSQSFLISQYDFC